MQLTIQQILAEQKRGVFLNFGPTKTGKTRVLHTLLKMGLKPGWIFDFDFGIEPLLRMAQTLPDFKEEDLKIFRYIPSSGDRVGDTHQRPTQQGKEIFEQFKTDFNKLYDLLDAKTQKWKPNTNAPAWICIDSWSALADIIMDFVLSNRSHNLQEKGTDNRSDYFFQQGKMIETIKSIQGLPVLGILNFHEKFAYQTIQRERGEPEKILIAIEPLITGQLSSTIGKEFSAVLYSKRTGDKYMWQTKPSGLIKTAGVRSKDNLPQEIEQDYSLILT